MCSLGGNNNKRTGKLLIAIIWAPRIKLSNNNFNFSMSPISNIRTPLLAKTRFPSRLQRARVVSNYFWRIKGEIIHLQIWTISDPYIGLKTVWWMKYSSSSLGHWKINLKRQMWSRYLILILLKPWTLKKERLNRILQVQLPMRTAITNILLCFKISSILAKKMHYWTHSPMSHKTKEAVTNPTNLLKMSSKIREIMHLSKPHIHLKMKLLLRALIR